MLSFVSLLTILLVTVSGDGEPGTNVSNSTNGDDCVPFVPPPLNPQNPLDDYGTPCLPSGKAGKPKRVGRKTCSFWDFIVVGAGSAGSALASRLSEDGKYRVLLLEPGLPESLIGSVPMYAVTLKNTPYNWAYQAEPVPGKFTAYTGGIVLWPRGLGIGGSSLINIMIYTRGNILDWDRTEAVGNYGWSWKDVLPYFKKSEMADLGEISDNSDVHNENGALSIQYARYRTPLADIFIQAGDELGKKNDDYNDGYTRGFSYVQTHTLNGRRHSAARAYLYPYWQIRPNLDIFYNCTVTKVNIVSKVAKSINYVYNGTTYHACARKEIILSAGAIGSPQLLMLSGIGPAKHLKEIGIPLKKNLKVGETLFDHPMFPNLMFTMNTTGLNLKENEFSQYLNQWLATGTGPNTMITGIEALAFTKTKASDDPDDYPDIEYMFGSVSLGNISSRSFNIDEEFFEEVYGEVRDVPSFSIMPIQMHSKSKGSLKLRDKNYASKPIITYDYFSDDHDLETMLQGIKYAIKISKTKAFQAIGTKLHDKPFPMCKDIKFGSDAYWRCALKAATTTCFHPHATCKMGPSWDRTAVVDPKLRVYGIKNLRVCDASIIPTPPTAHTHAPAVMIGEKCADIIKAKYQNHKH